MSFTIFLSLLKLMSIESVMPFVSVCVCVCVDVWEGLDVCTHHQIINVRTLQYPKYSLAFSSLHIREQIGKKNGPGLAQHHLGQNTR